ncbi:MAG TPA: hypothetical protein VIV56_14165 [Gemmatimonadales bacterium]
MTTKREALKEKLAWLRTPDCTCEHRWGNYGKLYGISMGEGWNRVSTDPRCPHHAIQRGSL